MLRCSCCGSWHALTSDDRPWVEAAVLLAPVGCNPCSFGEESHRWGLHVNDLRGVEDQVSYSLGTFRTFDVSGHNRLADIARALLGWARPC